MKTSLIERLELPNSGHKITSAIESDSCNKILVGDVIDRNYDVMTFILKCLYLKKA